MNKERKRVKEREKRNKEEKREEFASARRNKETVDAPTV